MMVRGESLDTSAVSFHKIKLTKKCVIPFPSSCQLNGRNKQKNINTKKIHVKLAHMLIMMNIHYIEENKTIYCSYLIKKYLEKALLISKYHI